MSCLGLELKGAPTPYDCLNPLWGSWAVVRSLSGFGFVAFFLIGMGILQNMVFLYLVRGAG